jgi:4a-hydroxytetrahydrobiopterin dehydratase
MDTLSQTEVAERLRQLPGWRLDGSAITKQYAFDGFPAAVAFVGRLVPGAEAADHHPDITVNYRRVTLSYTTHSDGGLTDKDFVGAAAADQCV